MKIKKSKVYIVMSFQENWADSYMDRVVGVYKTKDQAEAHISNTTKKDINRLHPGRHNFGIVTKSVRG